MGTQKILNRQNNLKKEEQSWRNHVLGLQTLLYAVIVTIFISSVQSISRVQLFETPWTGARQASLTITNSRSLLKIMSIELVMPSNYLM